MEVELEIYVNRSMDTRVCVSERGYNITEYEYKFSFEGIRDIEAMRKLILEQRIWSMKEEKNQQKYMKASVLPTKHAEQDWIGNKAKYEPDL